MASLLLPWRRGAWWQRPSALLPLLLLLLLRLLRLTTANAVAVSIAVSISISIPAAVAVAVALFVAVAVAVAVAVSIADKAVRRRAQRAEQIRRAVALCSDVVRRRHAPPLPLY